ncbi:hypothetical protein ILUMI_17919 [Ignelater luminosus]|uniref:Uncharacterized protein n=1 Tax=Ignelater luminosus TaxID=2038154 RepID=A0A8K0G6W3_IGNLU|nr:hypothetical protein ILUMI_17919 [Ignelater luminosus]
MDGYKQRLYSMSGACRRRWITNQQKPNKKDNTSLRPNQVIRRRKSDIVLQRNIRKSQSKHTTNNFMMGDFNCKIGIKQRDDENYIRIHGLGMRNPRDKTIQLGYVLKEKQQEMDTKEEIRSIIYCPTILI